MLNGALHPLKRWRLSKGLTLQQVADQIGTKRSTVHHYETGRRLPHRKIMPRIIMMADGALSTSDFYTVRESAE